MRLFEEFCGRRRSRDHIAWNRLNTANDNGAMQMNIRILSSTSWREGRDHILSREMLEGRGTYSVKYH